MYEKENKDTSAEESLLYNDRDEASTSSEVSEELQSITRPRRRWVSRLLYASPLIIIKDIILVLLATYTAFTFLHTPPLPRGAAPPPAPCHCGSSVSEALSLNCAYDSLAASWLPAECRDDELTAQFEQSGDGPNGEWLYWADKNHTKLLTKEEMAMNAFDRSKQPHVSWQWHKMHCFFYWRKEWRTRDGGKRRVEEQSSSEAHVLNCGKMFLHNVCDG
ncbi:hypothetical protein ACMFMG_003318 [Clarireedia jacksonii]